MAEKGSSFAFLAHYGPQYVRLAVVAERALALDPNLTVIKTRQLAEALARQAAARAGLASHVEQARDLGVRLERAALAKAFRGELVPQDPTDEPASVLLERIRAAGAEEAQRPRRGRGANVSPAQENQERAGAPNGGSAESADGEPVDLVVAALQQARRLTTSAIASATGPDAAAVRKALRTLVEGGHVRVEGHARGTSYLWGAI